MEPQTEGKRTTSSMVEGEMNMNRKPIAGGVMTPSLMEVVGGARRTTRKQKVEKRGKGGGQMGEEKGGGGTRIE